MKSYKLIQKLACLLFLFCVAAFMTSCEDEEVGIDRFEVSVSELPDSVSGGQSIPLKIIAANAESIQIIVTPEGLPDEVAYEESIEAEGGRFVYNVNIRVPADDWKGYYVIDMIAHSGSETATETRTVYIKEGERELYLVGGSSEVGWEPANGIKLNRHEKDVDGVIHVYHDIFTYLTVAGDGFKVVPTRAGWEGAIGLDAGEMSNEEGVGNFTVEEDGFYRIRFEEDKAAPSGFSSYEIVKSNWGIIGSATPGSWDNDTDMVGPDSKGDYSWTATITLVEGEMKFRENDIWDVNLGGSESALTFDGANIPMTAGTYTITLNLDPEGYTFTVK